MGRPAEVRPLTHHDCTTKGRPSVSPFHLEGVISIFSPSKEDITLHIESSIGGHLVASKCPNGCWSEKESIAFPNRRSTEIELEIIAEDLAN